MSFTFSTTPVYVSEGQTVRFKFKAPSAWNTTQSVTIQIGDQQTIWYITTIPEDFAPDPFPFTTLLDADPDQLYVYGDGSRPGEAIITVSGLTPSTQASITLLGSLEANEDNYSLRVKRVSIGETEYGEWFIPAGNYVVENTDEIEVRLKSNIIEGLTSFVDLSIGARTERWTIETAVTPPNIPEPFPEFDAITNAPLNKTIYSNIVKVQGLNDIATIITDNGALIGVSNTNTFFTNVDGYEVLSGITFEPSSNNPTIINGQYLQLSLLTPNTVQTTTLNVLGIGDENAGSAWSVRTGNFPSTTPDAFNFQDQSDVPEDELIASNAAPVSGITGLGAGVEVDVVLVSTTGTEPRVKVIYAEGGESSVGLFPTKVNNGDQLVIYNRSSATFGESIETTIRVGQREILPWTVVTNNGPDTDASFTPPNNLTNRAPNKEVVSSIVTVAGINRPIEINATNGALISIDFDTPVAGPRTFDPRNNEVFQLYITTDPNLSGSKSTVVTVGTGTTNNPFTWTVSNYAVEPPPPELKGSWYSKKNSFIDNNGDIRESKDDGYAIGTVVPILKKPDGTYGDLEGTISAGKLDARFPGYLECDGSEYNVVDFPDLFFVIGNTYGGSGDYDTQTKTYTGTFKVPDLRNRKLTGTGVVDGNKASSAFLPVEGGGSVYEPGGTGGWWYVDNVDVAGDNPYEQVLGDAGANTGTSSNFFSIGTVKTSFNAPIQADIEFTVFGGVTAQVGPLTETLVNVPVHTHLYVSGVTDGNTGDPLILWGQPALMFGPGAGLNQLAGDTKVGWQIPRFNNPFNTVDGAAQSDTGAVADEYLAKLAEFAPNFRSQWDSVDGEDTLRSIVRDMIGRANTIDYGDDADPSNAQASDRESEDISADVWWPSPYDAVSDSYFRSVAGSGYDALGRYPDDVEGQRSIGAKVSAVIDTRSTTVRVEPYVPPITEEDSTSTTSSHSHLITTTPVIDPNDDFSYGNSSGWGNARQGLGSAATSINITFNQNDQSGFPGVGMSLNEGTFTLNSNIKKPIPDIVLSPNRKVPLVPEFHKVKYIIKAF
jgi:hypothetical protein